MKVVRIKESKLIEIIRENMDEMALTFDQFKGSDKLGQLRDAINKNKTVSVAFVKKDGSVRHMAFRKYLKSYEFSDREKTEKQLNVRENNNIYRVVDINKYIQKKKELIDGGADLETANKTASAIAWRTINLQTILGFLVGGNFYDLREENDIMEKFGETVYNTLTKSMVLSMNQEIVNLSDDVE